MVIGDREVDDDRALLAAQEAAPAPRQRGRAARLGHRRCPTPPRASAPTTARRRCRCRSSRSSPTRSRRSSRRARCSSRSTTSRSGRTRRRASRACSRRCGPTCAATRSRSSASTRCTSRCACSWPRPRSSALVGARRSGAASSASSVDGEGQGHVQSVILGACSFIAAVQLAALGVIGDILAGIRVLQQRTLERVRRVELQLGVEPSHYEPGASRRAARTPTTGADAGPATGQARGARDGRAREPGGSTPEVPTGNTYDKYGSTNPVVRRLMAGFEATLDELWQQAAPELDPRRRLRRGRAHREWAERLGDGRIVGIDLDDPKLRAEWEKRRAAEPRVPRRGGDLAVVRRRRVRHGDRDRGARARARPRARRRRDGARGASAGCSCRCRASRSGAGSTWRAARTEDLGNTPGHVNHWSKRGFVSLLSRHGTVEEVRSPFPWTMVLVRVG